MMMREKKLVALAASAIVSLTAATGMSVSGSTTAGRVDIPTYPGGLPQAAVIAIYDARLLPGTDGDPVAAWPDTGLLDQADLAQATSANQPVVNDDGFGGQRSVQFDGMNDRLDMRLAATYSDDFALIIVCELLTYTDGTAMAFYSTGDIPNKNILGVDDVEDPPGWVVMSADDGTQAQHHHGTFNQAYLEDVPSRFIMTQLVRNDGEHRLWENNTLVIDLADSSGENSDLNNLNALKLGAREDNTRFVNVRIAYVLLVDMTKTDQLTLLEARDQIAADFAVPGFPPPSEGRETPDPPPRTRPPSPTPRAPFG